MIDINKVLKYKITNKLVVSKDYVDWAEFMISNGYNNDFLSMLLTFDETSNIFEVESYFNKAIKITAMREISDEDCAREYIRYIARNITQDADKCIKAIDTIFRVISKLDYPEDLMVWYELSELKDSYLYAGGEKEISKEEFIKICIEKTIGWR